MISFRIIKEKSYYFFITMVLLADITGIVLGCFFQNYTASLCAIAASCCTIPALIFLRIWFAEYFDGVKRILLALASMAVLIIVLVNFYNTYFRGDFKIKNGTLKKCYVTTDCIYVPDEIDTIGMQAFKPCKKLRTVNVGEGVKYIDHYAFANCSKLDEIYLPSTIKEIAGNAFYGSPIRYIYFNGTKEQWDDIKKSEGLLEEWNSGFNGEIIFLG